MAGESAVNRAAMATAYNQCQDAVDQVKAEQSRLAGFHSEMMGGWVGMAASAFTSAYTEFNADFTQVLSALQEIQEKLVSTQRRYTVQEQQQTAAANRVQGLLNR
jgi:WXG100 family type VII secretion target